MAYRLLHKKSCVKDKIPSADVLEYGELAINYNSEFPKIYIKDSENNIVSFANETHINSLLDTKQEILKSNVNIKTINNESIIGQGNVNTKYQQGKGIIINNTSNIIEIDTNIFQDLENNIANLHTITNENEQIVARATNELNTKLQTIANKFKDGNLTVVDDNSNKSFMIKNFNDSNESQIPLEISSQNENATYQYQFPSTNGTIPIGVKVGKNNYLTSSSDGLIDLSELDVKTNLGNGLSLDENAKIITKDKYIKKDVYLGDNSQPSGMTLNKITEEGLYEFYLQSRTYDTDDIPVLNSGNGHTIAGRLNVVDASLDDEESMITQKLLLSNRFGGEGKEYIRSCKEGVWTPWLTNVTMQEVGVTSRFDEYINNGMYSGVYGGPDIHESAGAHSGSTKVLCHQYETFVIVTINNYSVVATLKKQDINIPHSISQFKYALTPYGNVTFLKRVGTKNSNSISWGDWDYLYTD